MPKSKHRKKPPTSPASRPAKKPSFREDSDGTICIRPKIFETLRDNIDFANYVRVGRSVNTMTVIWELLNHTQSPLGHRLGMRTFYILGGYLYESFLVVDSLRLGYCKEKFFDGFSAFLSDEKNREYRKILQKMRNSTAFHLDSDNRDTLPAVSKIDLDEYPFVSKGGMLDAAYSDIVDLIDLQVMTNQLQLAKASPHEVMERMGDAVCDSLLQFLAAADMFMFGIADKLGLYSKRQYHEHRVLNDKRFKSRRSS